MSEYSDEVKDEVVRLYQEGVKGEVIAQLTGVPRPTVYLFLRQRGLMASRQKVMQGRQLSAQELVEQLAASQRTIGRLEAEIDQLKSQIAYMSRSQQGSDQD